MSTLLTYPDILPSPMAISGDKNTIPAEASATTGQFSYSLGFPPVTQLPISAGGIAPQRADFNGAFYALSNFQYYAQSGAPIYWNENLNYPVNSRCYDYTNGIEYICLIENGADVANVGAKQPSLSVNYWQDVNAQSNTNASDISDLQSSVSTNTSNISDLQTAVTSAQTTADNAQTTANAKWTAVSASTSQQGITQLTNSVTSTSTTMAATPYAVKLAYDKAVAASSSGGSFPSGTYIELSTSLTTYTPTVDGWLYFVGNTSNSDSNASYILSFAGMTFVQSASERSSTSISYTSAVFFLPIKAGTTVSISSNSYQSRISLRFYIV